MSEIQRYTPHHTGHSHLGTTMAPATIPAPSGYVLFTDHEAAIEQVLADAKARIEAERIESDGMDSWENGYHVGIEAALAALTQPQTERERFGSRPYTPEQREFMEKVVSERQPLPQPVFPLEDDGGGAAAEKCPEDCDGFGQLIGDSDGPCPACSGLEPDRGGAAAEKCPTCGSSNPDYYGQGCDPETGFNVFHAGGGAATPRGVAEADLELPLTNSTLVEEVIAAVYEACLDRAMDDPDAIEVAAVLRGELTGTRTTTEPSPYAKAFRERVCPVPEFPGIKNRQEDQA